MTINTEVRVKRGQFRGKVGIIRAICEGYEFLVDFDFTKERHQGYWISGFYLEML